MGRTPNGAKLRCDAAGVHVSERGYIPVDRQQRTNVPHIFAIGDVVGQPMLAHKATHEAKVAAEVIAGHKRFFDARSIPSVAYTDPEIAWAGVDGERNAGFAGEGHQVPHHFGRDRAAVEGGGELLVGGRLLDQCGEGVGSEEGVEEVGAQDDQGRNVDRDPRPRELRAVRGEHVARRDQPLGLAAQRAPAQAREALGGVEEPPGVGRDLLHVSEVTPSRGRGTPRRTRLIEIT